MLENLPDWLRLWFQSALIGEIYDGLRAIAVGYSDKHEMTVRYYLDHEPKDFDRDSLESIVSEVLSNTFKCGQIDSVKEECVFSDKKIENIDKLSGLVFARKENRS